MSRLVFNEDQGFLQVWKQFRQVGGRLGWTSGFRAWQVPEVAEPWGPWQV